MGDTIVRDHAQTPPERERAIGKSEEILAFVIIVVLVWPVVAIGVVGGYGFLVWMLQLVLGPPGPPGA
jgi:nitrate reductase NapE